MSKAGDVSEGLTRDDSGVDVLDRPASAPFAYDPEEGVNISTHGDVPIWEIARGEEDRAPQYNGVGATPHLLNIGPVLAPDRFDNLTDFTAQFGDLRDPIAQERARAYILNERSPFAFLPRKLEDAGEIGSALDSIFDKVQRAKEKANQPSRLAGIVDRVRNAPKQIQESIDNQTGWKKSVLTTVFNKSTLYSAGITTGLKLAFTMSGAGVIVTAGGVAIGKTGYEMIRDRKQIAELYATSLAKHSLTKEARRVIEDTIVQSLAAEYSGKELKQKIREEFNAAYKQAALENNAEVEMSRKRQIYAHSRAVLRATGDAAKRLGKNSIGAAIGAGAASWLVDHIKDIPGIGESLQSGIDSMRGWIAQTGVGSKLAAIGAAIVAPFKSAWSWVAEKTGLQSQPVAKIETPKAETPAASTPAPEVAPAIEVTEVVRPTSHVIVKGDSLWKIAHENGISVQQLAQANGIKDIHDVILPGHELKIPTPDLKVSAPVSVDVAAPSTDVVAPDASANVVSDATVVPETPVIVEECTINVDPASQQPLTCKNNNIEQILPGQSVTGNFKGPGGTLTQTFTWSGSKPVAIGDFLSQSFGSFLNNGRTALASIMTPPNDQLTLAMVP